MVTTDCSLAVGELMKDNYKIATCGITVHCDNVCVADNGNKLVYIGIPD